MIKRFIYLCALCCWSAVCYPQLNLETANFRRIGIEEGLANPQIHTMMKDSRGFVWLGTVNGLIRYDGMNFKNYYHIYGDSTSLSQNEVWEIVEDDKGYLYVASSNGLNRFDPRTETFEIFLVDRQGDHVSAMNLQCLHYEGGTKIYAGEITTGLYVFDTEKETFEHYQPLPLAATWQQNRSRNCIYTIHQDVYDPDLLWLGMRRNRIYSFRKSTKELKERFNPGIRFDSSVRRFRQNEPDVLWMARSNGGIARFDVKTGKGEEFYLDPNKYHHGIFEQQRVRDIEWKSETELYVPFQEEGLWVFDIQSRRFDLVKENLTNPRGWRQSKWTVIEKTSDGLLWFAHAKPRGEVLTIYDPSANIFTPLPILATAETDKVPNRATELVFRKSNQRYYLSIYGDEVQVFDENWNYEKPHSLDDGRGGEYLNISLFLDSQDRLWVNRKYRFWVLNDSTKQYEQDIFIEKGGRKFKDRLLTCIMEDRHKNIWFGSITEGLLKLDFARDTFLQYTDSIPTEDNIAFNQRIHSIVEDETGNIWLATYAGLVKFDPISEKFTYWRADEKEQGGLIKDNIFDMEKDAKGRLWLAFRQGGAQVFDPITEQFVHHFSHKDGLLSDQVERVVRDSSGHMWLASVVGLMKYREAQNDFIHYGHMDGLQETWMTDQMLSVTPDGRFYLGSSNNAFYQFHPDSFFIPPLPNIVFTGFKVHNKDYLKDTSIDHRKHIFLDYTQNNVTFEFAALNFHLPKKNRYAWQLEGVDPNWVYFKNSQMSASYNNLAPGQYTFRVKASNNEQVWNEEGRTVHLTITPPWWQTKLAYVTYALLAMALLGAAFRFQRRRLQLQSSLQLEQEEARRLKELDEVKSRMYANVTHEFRTPVTVILGMADEIRRQPENQLYNRLGLIERNGRKLLGLVSQLLNMTRLEAGALEYQPVQADVIAFLKNLTKGFQPFADSQGLELVFENEIGRLEMDFDPEKLERVMTNLLSNAIKFTETGDVEIVVGQKDNCLIISVRDTGIGISKEDLPKIFDRFYQTDASTTRKWEGTGIGLSLAKDLVELMSGQISVKSQIGEGAVFTVQLPIRKEAAFLSQPLPSALLQKQTPVFSLPSKESGFIKTPKDRTEENSLSPLLLIIEDNRDIVEYLTICLRDHYRLEIAFDGAVGLEKAFHLIPDIVLSDVMMPEKDGFEVCRTLKNDERTSHIPIVLLTAKAAVDDRLRGLRRGADAYLSKPFYKEELLVRLEQLVALRIKLQTRYAHLSPLVEQTEEVLTQEDEFIKKVNALLESQLSNADLSVEEFAKQLFLSRMQLHRKLKALTGRSTTAYIRWYRLSRSQELLKNTDWSIGRIALEMGFSDVNYFSRSFNTEFGVRPSGFREGR